VRWAGFAIAVGLLLLTDMMGQTEERSTTGYTRRRPATAQIPLLNLVGRVLMDTGEPPRDVVRVELLCNGRVRSQTQTAQDGTFSFDIGGPRNDDVLDPAVGGSYDGSLRSIGNLSRPGPGQVFGSASGSSPDRLFLGGCEIRTSPKPGFASESINLRARDSIDNPDVGVIILRRLSNAEATTISLNTLAAPKKAQEAYESAQKEIGKEKPDLKKATKLLKRAVDSYPRFSAAWELLARVHLAQEKTPDAVNCLLKAIEAEPGFISPYIVLAQISIQKSDWAGTADWTGKVLTFDNENSTALYWNGLSYYYMGRFDRAEPTLSGLYRKGRDLEEEYPFGLLPLGVMHANQGKIREAAREFKRYLQFMPSARVPAEQRTQLLGQIATWEHAGLIQEATDDSTIARTTPE